MGFDWKTFPSLENADTCATVGASPIEKARQPQGAYPDQHSATEISGANGRTTSEHGDSEFVQSPPSGLEYRTLLLETLDRIGCGGVVLDGEQNVVAVSAVAIDILKRRIDGHTEKSDADEAKIASRITQFLNAIALPREEEDWVTVWQSAENPLAIIRIPTGEDTVLMLVDVGTRLQPSTETLRRMFGLTSAESKLALGLASGSSPNDLALQIGVRKTTIRSQLASVFSKTQTTRQGELVALLARVSILP
jgi:DNA-binding CsgD family transcriptional regulator